MRDEGLFIDDILEATEDLKSFVAGKTLENFSNDKQFKFAVLKRLEDIGEAAKHLSEPTCRRISSIDWKRVKGFRDIAAHQYFAMDWKLVWDAATQDAPVLAEAVRIFREREA
jgi:uncharacterized protein with HEPN domain